MRAAQERLIWRVVLFGVIMNNEFLPPPLSLETAFGGPKSPLSTVAREQSQTLLLVLPKATRENGSNHMETSTKIAFKFKLFKIN